jgi:uncharacterized protein (TIGR03067 family)
MMKSIFRALALLVVIALYRPHSASADLGNNDFRQLQGTWTLVYAELSGMQVSYDYSGLGRLSVRGSRYLLGPHTPGAGLGEFVLNARSYPRQIDFTPMTGLNAGRTLHGIYEILGDTHKVCFAAPGQPRPASFTSLPGPGQLNYVWLRTSKPSQAGSRFRNVAPEFDFPGQ